MKWWMKAAIPAVIMPAMLVVGYRSSPSSPPPAAPAAAEAPAAPAPARPERKSVETKADDSVARHEKARLELAAEADAAKRKTDAARSAEPELTAKEELGGVGRHNPLGRSPAPIAPAEMRQPERAPGEPALVGDGEDCKTCRQVESSADIRVGFTLRPGLGGRRIHPIVANLRSHPQRNVVVTLTIDGVRRTWTFAEVPPTGSVTAAAGMPEPRKRDYTWEVDVVRDGVRMGKHTPRTETVCDPRTGTGSLAFQEPGK